MAKKTAVYEVPDDDSKGIPDSVKQAILQQEGALTEAQVVGFEEMAFRGKPFLIRYPTFRDRINIARAGKILDEKMKGMADEFDQEVYFLAQAEIVRQIVFLPCEKGADPTMADLETVLDYIDETDMKHIFARVRGGSASEEYSAAGGDPKN